MGDPYVQVTWGHYYHIGDGSYIPSCHYLPPPYLFPVGLQPRFYSTNVPQGSYACYQPRWNMACPGPSEDGRRREIPIAIKKDCSEQEFASDCHGYFMGIAIDISPDGSPEKQPSQPLVRFRGTVGSFQPGKLKCTNSTCKVTKSVLPPSSPERVTSHTEKTLNRTKTQWSNQSPTASSITKCNARTRTLVQASGTSSCVKREPRTCVRASQQCESIACKFPKASAQATVSQHQNKFHIKRAPEKHVAITESSRPCVARSVANWSQHVLPRAVESVASHSRHVAPHVLGPSAGGPRVEPCVSRSGASQPICVVPRVSRYSASQSQHVETIIKSPFNQHVREDCRPTNTVVKPRRRVIVRHINGVARLFAVSPRSPLNPNAEYTLIGKGADKPLDNSISNSMEAKEPKIVAGDCVAEIAIPEKSSKQVSAKSSMEDLKQGKCSPVSLRSRRANQHSGSANVRHHSDELKLQSWRSAPRRRDRWKQKHWKKRDCLPPSSEMCTNESLASALCMQKSTSTGLANRCEDVLGSKEPVNGLHTVNSSVAQCVQVNAASRAALPCTLSPESPGVKDADTTRILCKGQPFTSDVLCSEKPVTKDTVMSGIYAPRKVFATVTACTGIEVDPSLGGCKEHEDGPFKLQSQLEKLDEGWMWSFD